MMSWLYWYCVLSHCLFTLILYKLIEDINSSSRSQEVHHHEEISNTNKNLDKVDSVLAGSSVWCYGHHKKDRICKFRNLCYSTDLQEYIFFHGPLSIVENLPAKRCSPALLDLSSVDDHNLQYFHYLDAPAQLALKYFTNITIYNEPSLIFHRFNPENLMHVIHDDLLPMFATLRQYYPDFENATAPFNSQVQLIFMEGREEGPFFQLFKLFSERLPMVQALLDNHSLLCFREAVVGISKVTTWYDYGFNAPQGPKTNHTADSTIIHQFTQFIMKKLGINKKSTKSKDYVILFSREDNRLILNEFDLAFAISTNFHLRVLRLSLETNTLFDIIESVKNSAGIIGMHGSILVLAMFLSPGSFLVELFPYAIDPQNYTPYKTLTQLAGMDVSYGSWSNEIKGNSVIYPNRSREEGGITHLRFKEQEEILNAEIIPQHLCCEDPYWLFRIYQDTVVDIASFLQVMQTVLDQRQQQNSTLSWTMQHAHPGKIKKVHCSGTVQISHKPAVFVAWQPSWNTHFFSPQDVGYEVWMQSQTTKEYMAFALDAVTEYTFTEGILYGTNYSIWVREILFGHMGPFSDVCMYKTS